MKIVSPVSLTSAVWKSELAPLGLTLTALRLNPVERLADARQSHLGTSAGTDRSSIVEGAAAVMASAGRVR